MIFSADSSGCGQSRIPGGRVLQADSSSTIQGREGLAHVHCLKTSLIPHREEWDSLSERLETVGQGGTHGVTGDSLTPALRGKLGAGGEQEKKELMSWDG